MGRNWYRKKYEHELILSKHQPEGPHPLVVVLDHLKAGFNVPKIIRSAHAFGCREIHLVSIPLFDPSPAKGTFRQTRSRSFTEFAESHDALLAEGYTLFALDHRAQQVLGEFELPRKSAFILGHEEFGHSFDREKFPKVRGLRIRQFGQVQSLNVSVAASLACYEWARQHVLAHPPVLA